MKRDATRILYSCSLVLAAFTALHADDGAPKRTDGATISPIGAPPPCICPLWPVEEFQTASGTEYLYYSECYFSETCMGDPEAAYLEGVFPWPVFCPSEDCEALTTKLRPIRQPKDFQGLQDFAPVNDRTIRKFPTPVARRHSRELPPLTLNNEAVRFVWIDVNRTRHYFEIVRVEVAVPSESSDGRAETRIREFILGKEIQEPPQGVTPAEVQAPTPIDKIGKPTESSLAYRGKIANRSILFLFKAP